jgi:hypothetical protein
MKVVVAHCIFKKKASGKSPRPKELVGGIDFATCRIGKQIDKSTKRSSTKNRLNCVRGPGIECREI